VINTFYCFIPSRCINSYNLWYLVEVLVSIRVHGDPVVVRAVGHVGRRLAGVVGGGELAGDLGVQQGQVLRQQSQPTHARKHLQCRRTVGITVWIYKICIMVNCAYFLF